MAKTDGNNQNNTLILIPNIIVDNNNITIKNINPSQSVL